MDRLMRTLTGLLRGLAELLGEHRRDWVHALLAETDEQPTTPARLASLGGGWGPRLVRIGGYAVVLALIAATAVQQRIAANSASTSPSSCPSGRWTWGSC